MNLRLSLVGSGTPSSHVFGPEGGIFGRSRKCDWVLPDDERILSAIHGRVVYRDGAFTLVDESSNGIFIDGMPQPIGRGNATTLIDGLHFHAGRYQIEARLMPATTNAQTGPAMSVPASAPQSSAPRSIPPSASTAENALRDRSEYGGMWGNNSQDPLNYLASEPVDAPIRPQPAAAAGTLPNGLDLARALEAELSPPVATTPGPPNPPHQVPAGTAPAIPTATDPAPSPPRTTIADAAPADSATPAGPVATGSAAAQIPEDFLSRLGPVRKESEAPSPPVGSFTDSPSEPKSTRLSAGLLADLVEPGASTRKTGTSEEASALHDSAHAPVAQASPTGLNSMEALKVRREQRKAALLAKSGGGAEAPGTRRDAAAPRPSPPPAPVSLPAGATASAPAVAGHITSHPAASDAALVRTLLQSMGFPEAEVAPEDHEQLMRDVGSMVREVAAGLILILTARRIVKSEFRLDETRIEPEENNPFKFFKVPELALDELLLTRSGGFQEPAEATKAAFQDIQQHTMVTMSAMQQAIRMLFERLSPDTIAAEEDDDSGLRIRGLGARKGKWEIYQDSHARMSGNMSAITRQIIAEAFARVEEEQARQQAKGRWGKSQ